MSTVLKYSILRYFPWPDRDEFVNVGVILEGPTGTIYRLQEPRCVNYQVTLSSQDITEFWETVEFSLFGTMNFDVIKAIHNGGLHRPLEVGIEQSVKNLSGDLQCSDIRSVIIARQDPNIDAEYLNVIFDRQVSRRLKRMPKKTLDRQHLLKRRLKSDFANWKIIDKLEVGDLIIRAPWPMDFIYTNGMSVNGLKVLDCSLRGINDGIRIVFGSTKDVQESGRSDICIIGIIGNRKSNDNAYSLVTNVLGGHEMSALKLFDYDTEGGKAQLRKVLVPLGSYQQNISLI